MCLICVVCFVCLFCLFCLFVLFVCFVCLYVCLFVCLFVCLPVSRFACLLVCFCCVLLQSAGGRGAGEVQEVISRAYRHLDPLSHVVHPGSFFVLKAVGKRRSGDLYSRSSIALAVPITKITCWSCISERILCLDVVRLRQLLKSFLLCWCVPFRLGQVLPPDARPTIQGK